MNTAIHLFACVGLAGLVAGLLHLRSQRDFLRLIFLSGVTDRVLADWPCRLVQMTAIALDIPVKGQPGKGRVIPMKIDLRTWGAFLQKHKVACFRFGQFDSRACLTVELAGGKAHASRAHGELSRILSQAVNMPVRVVGREL